MAAIRLIVLCLLLVGGAAPTARAQAAAGPRATVEALHAALLDVMKNAKALGYEGRYRRLAPAVAATYHLDTMVRIIAGYHWRKFTDTQRRALADAFARMTVATYAHRFDGYGGERFVTVAEKRSGRDSALVKTQIVKSNGEAIALDYRLKLAGGRWGIIDVYLKGTISELATRRSEYSSVIRRKGLDALLTAIEAKIRAYGKR